MAGDDTLDVARARFYRWGATGAEDRPASAPSAPRIAHRDARAARDFAALVQRVWSMADLGLQAHATIGLAERAEELSLELAGMPPQQGVQLLRLIARHRPFIDPQLYEKLPSALMWCSLDAPELADLLVEVAESGDAKLEFLLILMAGHPAPSLPGLGRLLLPILGAQGQYRARELAATFAAWAADWSVVVPELRRALGEPSQKLRLVALRGLLANGGLQALDVQLLLDDLVVHPPLDSTSALSDTCYQYGCALHEAVVKFKPAQGYRPLLAIVHSQCAFVHGWRALDDSFALQLLAAAYPEHAIAEIDWRLESTANWDRRCALRAAAELDDALARPRLRQGTGDPDASVCGYAREVWVKRFGKEPCAEPELPIELEQPTPSQSLESHLTVLRGNDPAARLDLVKALLTQAPEREALALLLYALRDHALWVGVREVGLPQTPETWAAELCQRFGDQAFEGLMVLAERQAKAGVERGWLSALAKLPKHGALSERQIDSLRSLAVNVLMSAEPGVRTTDAILTLGKVGAPDSCFDHLWAVAFESVTASGAEHTWRQRDCAAHAAIEALGHAGRSPALDARISSEFSAALERRDFAYAAALIQLGLLRTDVPGLAVLTERALALCAGELTSRPDGAVLTLASRCAEFVHKHDTRPPERVLRWLENPNDPLFIAAVDQVPMGGNWAVPALLAALESTAAAGAVAARAGERLLCIEAIEVLDARLDAALARAPLRDGIALAAMMFYCGAVIGRVSDRVLEALCSGEADLAEAGAQALGCSRKPLDIWGQALQRGVHPSIEEYARTRAGLPSLVEQYWQDVRSDVPGPGQAGSGIRIGF